MKSKICKLKISAIGTKGEGIAKTKDLTYFVPFCLENEEIEAEVVRQKNNVADAKMTKIVKSANGRVKPKCNVFGKCGGCQLQHMSYDLQLQYKQNLVKNNLKKLGDIDFDVLPVVPSKKQYGYRNKLQMPFGFVNNNVVSGFYKIASHDLVPTQNCPLQESWADDLSQIVREYATENKISIYNEKKKNGLLRHMVARYVQNQLLLTLVVNGDELPNINSLVQKLDNRFDKYGLFLNVNKAHTNVILGKTTKKLFGIDCIEGDCCGVKYNLQPTSFFQINDDIREKLYNKTIQLLDVSNCDIIVDCFSGIGILSGVLAKSGKPVFAIEIVPQATQDAEKLKKINGFDNLTNICADVNVEFKNICDKYKDKQIALVLDPPRKGLDEMTKQTILDNKPSNIVYISCNSATLARDLKDLSKEYDLSYCEPYDMFPQTANVETVVLLTKHKN